LFHPVPALFVQSVALVEQALLQNFEKNKSARVKKDVLVGVFTIADAENDEGGHLTQPAVGMGGYYRTDLVRILRGGEGRGRGGGGRQ
jgi:hypothetical protein